MNFNSIIKFLESKDIYIFGTGGLYEKYKDVILKYNIKGFLDNNSASWGSVKDQHIIYNPSQLTYSKQTYIIIMSSFINEISNQLQQYGLVKEEDYCTYLDLDNALNLHRIIETGHFYSPVPNTNEIFSNNYESYVKSKEYKGINLNIKTQEEFMQIICSNNKLFDQFLAEEHNPFYLNNGRFEYVDSITYFTVINYFNPKKIIEIGSGFSSVLAIETARFLDLDIELTFIEPYPETLEKLLPEETYDNILIQEKVQTVQVDTFEKLDENDILFIDSSHVSKVDSDVNYLFFEVLPSLKKGIIIHIHDIFTSFEYPVDWTYQGRFWNESYLLRAFLQYNNEFEILCFNNFIFSNNHQNNNFLDTKLVNGDFGGSIWLRKLS